MIGETLGFPNLSATTGSFPDHTAEVTTLVKVNQDGYATEYRFRGTDYDYVLKLRNTIESPRKSDGLVFTRHNAEMHLILRAEPDVPELPYIVSCTARLPKGGEVAKMTTLAGQIATRWAVTTIGSQPGGVLSKMMNFES